MPSTYNIKQTDSEILKLITRVLNGEEIIIAKTGKPVAKIMPIKKNSGLRKSGTGKGMIKIHKNFTDTLPEPIINEFEK